MNGSRGFLFTSIRIGVFGWLALSATLAARDISPPLQEKFEAVAAEIDREEKAEKLDEIDARQARTSLAAVQKMAGQRTSFETLLSHARNTATTAKTPELRQAWSAALAQLSEEEKAATDAQKKLFDAREDLFKRAAEACANAKSPDDLKGVLAELQNASRTPPENTRTAESRALNDQRTQLVQAMNFVSNWKEMLADATTGEDPSAISRLKSLSRASSGRVAQQIPTTLLEARLKELQDKRAAKLDEVLKNSARDLPTAKTANDAQKIADALRAASEEIGTSRRGDQTLPRAAEAAQIWTDMLRAEEQNDFSAAYEKLLELTPRRARNEAKLIAPETIEAKRKALWTRLSGQSEAALAHFSDELRAAKTATACADLAAKYQGLSEDLGVSGSGSWRRQPEFTQLSTRLAHASSTATAWAAILGAVEQQRWTEALRALSPFSKSTQPEIDAGLVPSELLAEKRKLILQKVFEGAGGAVRFENEDADWHHALARSIAAVAKPEEAAALAEAARKLAPVLDENASEDLQNLSRDLSSLVAEWRGGTPSDSENRPAHTWRAETQSIRDRLLRERLARQFSLPEIAATPLDAQPLETALRTLANQCAERHEWRRALDCLTATRQISARNEPLRREMQAISDFLAGGNFEHAEQFPEAIRSYQSVLREPNGRVPIVEASDRLRALKKEHPALFSSKSDGAENAVASPNPGAE